MMTYRLITAAAVAGWVLFGLSILESGFSDDDGQTEIERLRQAAKMNAADRDALAAELERFKGEHQDLQHIRKQIAAASQELKHLEYLRARVSGEIDATHPQPSRATSQATPSAETSEPPLVGSLAFSKDDINTAQEALTRLGYGTLKADGVIGPGTRRAIEAFQQKEGLPVTGRLDADTMRAIGDNRAAMIAGTFRPE